MGKITFILGGARSGKSSFALALTKKKAGRTAFIATCRPLDEEMKRRIALHRAKRPSDWRTFEEPLQLSALVKKISPKFRVLIIDCLTLFISNILLKGHSDNVIEKRVIELLKILKKLKCNSILIANEVGLGVVPESKLGRKFRDLAGRINQTVAGLADEVFFITAGIPLKIGTSKGKNPTLDC
ncbi:MAG: bifunctional adenosylcobinamide kinase/adenosylcobinamide-phosphate guanylyltransferase [Elusimicrobiota bacterium]